MVRLLNVRNACLLPNPDFKVEQRYCRVRDRRSAGSRKSLDFSRQLARISDGGGKLRVNGI